MVAAFVIFVVLSPSTPTITALPYSQFRAEVKTDQVARVDIKACRIVYPLKSDSPDREGEIRQTVPDLDQQLRQL